MDKIIQRRYRKEGWEGIEDGVKSFLLMLNEEKTLHPIYVCFFFVFVFFYLVQFGIIVNNLFIYF